LHPGIGDGVVNAPKRIEERFASWRKSRITRDHATRVRPGIPVSRKARAHRVFANVNDGVFKRIGVPFVLLQHMVVCIRLKGILSENTIEVLSQKANGEALVGVPRRTEKEQMKMIGHQAIRWTDKGIARACVQEEDAEFVVKRRTKPAGGAVLDGHRPMYPGKTSIELSI
jgi:hypothetical protein